MNRLFFPLLIALAMAIATTTLHSQPPADIIGWGFDEFHIGGETGYHPRILRDSFSMDFTYQYGMYSSYSYMTDPTRWAAEPNVPRLKDLRAVVDQSVESGVKMVFAPDRLFFFTNNFSSLEHYHTFASDSLHLPDFKTKLMGDSIRIQTPSLYGLDLKVAHGHDTLLAGSPRFTHRGFRPVPKSFWELLGHGDSSHLFDMTVTMWASDTLDNISSSEVFIYLPLYRRLTEEVDTACGCKCPIYSKWGELQVTAGKYRAAKLLDSLREVNFTVNFLRDSIPNPDEPSKNKPRYYSPVDSWAEWSDKSTAFCDSLLTSLTNSGAIPANSFIRNDITRTLEGSDFYYEVFSTGRTPLQFLRVRFATHLHDSMLAGKFDNYLFEATDTLMNDNTLWPLMPWLALGDELVWEDYGASRYVTARLQRRMRELFPTTPSKWRGIFVNPESDYGPTRVMLGDLDSTAIKPIHIVLTHNYPIKTVAPAFYADSSKMNPTTFQKYFNDPNHVGSAFYRSTIADYLSYTDSMIGGLHTKMNTNCGAIDVAQFRYKHLGTPPYPVYNNIQTGGYPAYDSGGFKGHWDLGGTQPRTPEAIIAQSFLTLNCGNQGMTFSDLLTTGPHMGVFTRYGVGDSAITDSMVYARLQDYGDMQLDNPSFTRSSDTVKGIWLGYKQRFDAVRKMTSAIKRIDSLYVKLANDPMHQLSVERSQQSASPVHFATMPLLDTAYTIQAMPFVRPDSLGKYTDSLNGSVPVADSIQHTYLEITHYNFKDPQRSATGERVLLLTNKRTWPTGVLL